MSQDPNITAHYQTVMPYLILQNEAAFIEFMKTVFGAEEGYKAMRDEHVIMHGEVTVGGSTIMFADATDAFGVRPAGMFIYVPDADTTYRKALEAGAKSIMEPADQPYGRSCGIRDPFGNDWWPTTPPKS
jgi:PhnB protein